MSVIGVWQVMFLARTLGQSTFNRMEMLSGGNILDRVDLP